ncbi:MAG: VanZ family protein [Flavobacteriaceae bacterium]|nr:VanZ family protein [Flavobacteriaceae bacterium]
MKQFEGDSTFQFEQMDKIAHAISYCVLTLSWLLAIKDVRLKSKLQNTIALSCMLYGMVIEVLQTTLTTYRTASFLDILANLVGIIIALLLFKSVFKKIRAI